MLVSFGFGSSFAGLSACMYIHLCMHACCTFRLYAYIYIYVYIYICLYVYIYIYTQMHTNRHLYIHIHVCVCMHACTHEQPSDGSIYIYIYIDRHADHSSSADQPAKSAYSFEVANFVGSSFPFPLDLVAVSCCSFVVLVREGLLKINAGA